MKDDKHILESLELRKNDIERYQDFIVMGICIAVESVFRNAPIIVKRYKTFEIIEKLNFKFLEDFDEIPPPELLDVFEVIDRYKFYEEFKGSGKNMLENKKLMDTYKLRKEEIQNYQDYLVLGMIIAVAAIADNKLIRKFGLMDAIFSSLNFKFFADNFKLPDPNMLKIFERVE